MLLRLDPNNYRGITVLSIFTKMFAITFHDRLLFVYEAYGLIEEYNWGSQREHDGWWYIYIYINILNALIQRQIVKGDNLIVCFVDFSRAFDLINRHILFYKLFKTGLHGRMVDTMRSLYAKTQFRLKCNGSLSPLLATSTVVNQGVNASSCLLHVIWPIYVIIYQHQLVCASKKKYNCIYHGQMTCYSCRTRLMACKNNWMALQISVPQILWYQMKWRRKFLYLKNKRPVGLYSPLLIQIIQYCNKCLHVDASKTGWTPNKKGNQRFTFTAVCPTYSLTVLSKRPFSLKQEARQSN